MHAFQNRGNLMASIAIGQVAEPQLAPAHKTSPWSEVNAWVDLLPTIFIAVGGWIHVGTGPIAFRFTAAEEDSFARRLTRIALSFLIVVLISTRFKKILRICFKEKLFLALPALAFASVLWSQNRSHTLVDALNLALTTLFAVYLYLRYPGRRLLAFLTFSAAISLLISLASVIFVPSVGIDSFQQDAWRGIFGQRNNCAVICVFFLLAALHYRSRILTERMMRGFVVVVAATFIVMSGSRTGWLLAALALVLTYGLPLVQRMGSLDRIVFLMCSTIPLVVLGILVANNSNQLLATIGKDPTLTQRTIIWSEVFPSIAKRPVQGYGYSSFWMGLNGESAHAVLVTQWMEGQAQDGYLDALLGLGLLGFVPLIWMFGRALFHAWGSIQAGIGAAQIQFGIVVLLVVLMQNIGETSILLPLAIQWLYALLALLLLSRSKKILEVF
jgi:exopolysaccharide production protein ExoQ